MYTHPLGSFSHLLFFAVSDPDATNQASLDLCANNRTQWSHQVWECTMSMRQQEINWVAGWLPLTYIAKVAEIDSLKKEKRERQLWCCHRCELWSPCFIFKLSQSLKCNRKMDIMKFGGPPKDYGFHSKVNVLDGCGQTGTCIFQGQAPALIESIGFNVMFVLSTCDILSFHRDKVSYLWYHLCSISWKLTQSKHISARFRHGQLRISRWPIGGTVHRTSGAWKVTHPISTH